MPAVVDAEVLGAGVVADTVVEARVVVGKAVVGASVVGAAVVVTVFGWGGVAAKMDWIWSLASQEGWQ